MSQTKRLFVLAGAVVSATSFAMASEPATTDEVRAIVAEMINDAESRSSLLQGGGNAGYDKHFFLASSDNNFRLNIGGIVQFRYNLNFRDKADNTAGDDFESGFQNRRTKVDFWGNVVNPDWTYRVRLEASRSTGAVSIDYAYIGYAFGNGWKATMGQFKLPFLREELMSDSKQLAADRSITNNAFTQTYSQGVNLGYSAEDWKFDTAFSDGLRTLNTDYTSAAESDWGLTGRFEYKFAGTWKQFEDFTAEQDEKFGALWGAAVHFQQSRNTGNPADVDNDYLTYTTDLSFEGSGWNIYAAFVGSHNEARLAGPDPSDTDDFGAIVQAGWRFLPNSELFARWDAIFTDDNRVLGGGGSTFHFITFGWNQYIAGHAAKFTLDCVVSANKTGSLTGLSLVPGAGSILPDTGSSVLSSTRDTEVALRAQFQLLF
ncbi:MAG: hypothetical protein JNM07_03565 [Phycisphaerae bacterium]|nr:hypothetical protein [Phycisphaerae bacterium]